jgi:hypothetical protein
MELWDCARVSIGVLQERFDEAFKENGIDLEAFRVSRLIRRAERLLGHLDLNIHRGVGEAGEDAGDPDDYSVVVRVVVAVLFPPAEEPAHAVVPDSVPGIWTVTVVGREMVKESVAAGPMATGGDDASKAWAVTV